MEIRDKVVVVTGAARGIGEAIARRFAAEQPRGLVLSDIDADALRAVASELGAKAVVADVATEADTVNLIDTAEDEYGPVDLFCANAGIGISGDEQTSDSDWDRLWRINVMSHVHAARRLIPEWRARREGYFLPTVSAAGLLTNLKAAQYSVTKHAALAFAEWLAVTYGDEGIKVSALCPQGVRTRLLDAADEFRTLLEPVALDPADVAEAVVEGVREERFLILPHPEVAQYFQNKANDYDRWLGGMRKLQRNLFG
ncbi:MAG TPA: SDR family oxidoreductase [Acidimicrobiia bacterium]|jgi:NAD(P)-dependent dehydrogenase (short-subunit alcohol dehydrogenase family)|nr:SDR family oxidoreductase [Acidimicrobiia bacterium]